MAIFPNFRKCISYFIFQHVLLQTFSNGYISGPASSKQWSVTESTNGRARPGELIFKEEFNNLDLGVWSHEITMAGGGNGEFQIYANNRSNSYVKYGKLYVKPTLTADIFGENFLSEGTVHLGGPAPADQCTNSLWDGCMKEASRSNIINPVVSARLRTANAFAFKYGKVEVKAKLPTGDWLWPAIWLLPEKNFYGSWPASGEIDLLESRGNAELYDTDNVHIGVEQIAQTLHFGPFFSKNGWEKTHFEQNSRRGEGYNKAFHLYQLEWTPDRIKFSVDNEPVAEVIPSNGGFWELAGFPNNMENPWRFAENAKMAPFDQKFYIVVGLAVGGTNSYFPDSATSTSSRKPWNNESPTAKRDFWNGREQWLKTWKSEDAALIVDYIRVWAI
ncbi:Beta-1,3-glucan-binding protein [Orchesella cincta]|uniref:Beta-1,3-glucan-binding protein n=1 Tax=Orchesella cincta TaxID=48709 RepID=A0A1D2MHT1_ORCCI|nr:Beta-1,3-glucan-binding protein [Orchesella cincta]